MELNALGDPYAAPFSGGVWYDETVKQVQRCGIRLVEKKKYGLVTCYAESEDGRTGRSLSLM